MIAGILVPVLSLAIIFGFVAWVRYLRHLEYRAYYDSLGRSGQAAAPGDTDGTRPVAPPPPPMVLRHLSDPRSLMHRGVITAAVGLALVLGLWTLGVGPWLAAGLIPLFVGLVEVLFALIEPKP